MRLAAIQLSTAASAFLSQNMCSESCISLSITVDHRRSRSPAAANAQNFTRMLPFQRPSVLLNVGDLVRFLSFFLSTILAPSPRLSSRRNSSSSSSSCCRDRARSSPAFALPLCCSFLSLRFTTFTRDYHCESHKGSRLSPPLRPLSIREHDSRFVIPCVRSRHK